MKNYLLILLISFYSCNINTKKNTDNDTVTLNSKIFMSSFKTITELRSLKTGKIRKFKILIKRKDTIRRNGIIFFKLKINDHSDSLYIGLKDNIVYSFDLSKHYLDKSLVLKSGIQKGYYSFLFGLDYRIDDVDKYYDGLDKDTIFNFKVTKLINKKESDHFYYSNDECSLYFERITFSKLYGIKEATLYDKSTGEKYITR